MPKIVCFDFDDVLTDRSTVSKLGKLFGHKLQELKLKAEILEDNRNPKKFFRDVREALKLAKGIPYEYVEKVYAFVKLNKNAKDTLRKLNDGGYRIVIVSTNDEGLIRNFLKKNSIDKYIDRVYAAKVGVSKGLLTGEVFGDVIETEKVGIVKKIEKNYKIKRDDITYIGDGMTDLPIMKKVGRGILFCPNPVTNAEVLSDRHLMKMKGEGRLFLVEEKDLSKILEFIS
jgi:HAD superfamily phosphoserine phosphatase-like hydrolase